MNKLLEEVKRRTLQATELSDAQLQELTINDKSLLHDPFLYSDMDKLVSKLYKYAQYQNKHSSSLLVIDTDYDTDGIMSAAVLSAALDVFNINYRIYVPTMKNGYGLSGKAVDDILNLYQNNGYHVDMLLTADNGTNAIDGVKAAKSMGMQVLVTDHHLSGDDYAPADVIVNPNRILNNGKPDTYPYKGNAGAAVAWKAMLAYAMKYEDEKKIKLIMDLIVFAGIADVSDVMPITDENHYMVKEAVDEIQRLMSLQQRELGSEVYFYIKNTPYRHYNTVFSGLYDMINLLQKSKDDKRIAKGKRPFPLPNNEELIGWYLSPMLNAPRRIHATSHEGMHGLMDISAKQRRSNIESMIQMNADKSKMRNQVTELLNWSELESHNGNVVFINAEHGIAGLVAGQITSNTNRASMVFALPSNSDDIIYNYHQFDNQFNAHELLISASARSTMAQPLDVIMSEINRIRPDIIVGGGGHAQAAGYQIYYNKLSDFALLFDTVSEKVAQQIQIEYEKQVANGDIKPVVQNVIRFDFHDDETQNENYQSYNVVKNAKTFHDDLQNVYDYEETLRPFGKDFPAQTEFELALDLAEIKKDQYCLNLDFWKTLKFNLYGVDVLTFDVSLADIIKNKLQENNLSVIIVKVKLTMNSFRGHVTPQLQMSK